ncbi:hypothetical protein WDV91_07275 [Curtobacterium flaccumfaciens pv. flaccumfaciens]
MIDGDDCQPVVIDSDFIGLRAALVREFGAMEAIVRLIYFCTSTVMSLSWWRATGGDLAQSTGLSSDQIERVIVKLETSGHPKSAEHRDGRVTDLTK